MIEKQQSLMDPYKLILVDWKMPEMDGVELTRRVREHYGSDEVTIILTTYNWDDIMEEALDAGSIPIIALTANAFDEDVQLSLDAGMNAHLSKPVEPDALFMTLEKLIQD